MKNTFKQDKGVAGLTVLLSIVVMLFVIGLLVTVFALMSGEIQNKDVVYKRTASASVTNEAVTQANLKLGGDALAKATLRSAQCTIVEVYNNSVAGANKITSGNWTETPECTIKNITSEYVTNDWKVNYTYTYLSDQYGTVAVINDTSSSIASVTDWFDIVVVIGSMVVLILLTVIIITAIRSSGMTGESSGANQVGTA